MSIPVRLDVRKCGCSRWKRSDGAINLTARPACASLALAFAAATGSLPMSRKDRELHARQKSIGATAAIVEPRIRRDRIVGKAGNSLYV